MSDDATRLSVHFGEVVQQVRDRVDPDQVGIERYVAGEHMDSDDLEIRRWGLVSDGGLGPAFHLRFMPGHVLYGSRRTYLRKVAVASFEGVCANTTFVLATSRPDVVLPEFLPYLMQTDEFHRYSIAHSKGSVNPYINFSDLAKYELDVPSIADQERMLQAIREIRAAHHAHRVVHQAAVDLRSALAFDLLHQDTLATLTKSEGSSPTPRGWSVATFGDVCERITYGFTNPMPTTTEGPWMVTAADVRDGRIDYSTARHTSRDAYEGRLTSKSRARRGDVLLTKDGALGRVASVDADDVCINQSVAVLRPKDLAPGFLAWTLRAPGTQWRLLQDARGSAVKHIYISKVAQLPLLLPDVAQQARIVDSLERADAAVMLASNRLGAASDLVRRFVSDKLRSSQ